MSEPGGEQQSKKTNVLQAILLVGMLLVFLVIAAVSLTREPDAPRIESTSTRPAAVGETAPGDFMAQGAGLVGSLRNSAERQANTAGEGAAVDTLSQGQWNELLDALGKNPAGPPTAPVPSASTSSLEQAAEARREARLVPPGGVIEPDDARDSNKESDAQQVASDQLPAGTILDGALAQKVSSDYPGSPFVATISRAVRLPNGLLAIPAGSKLIGKTAQDDGPNAIIQGRVTLRAEKIIRPDGSEIALDTRVLDAAGIGAVPGPTDRHVLAQAGGVLAYAVIGATTASSTSGEAFSTGSQFRTEAVQGAGQQVSPLANRYLSVTPTVTPTAGTPIRIVLIDALVVSPYLEG